MKSNLFIFDPFAFDIVLKKSLLNARSQVFAPMFPNGMATHCSIENPMDRGAYLATVHGVVKIQTWLKRLRLHAFLIGEPIFMLLIHFEWHVLWSRGPTLFFGMWLSILPRTILLKRLLFMLWMIFSSLSKLLIHRQVGLFLSFISWTCISIFMPHHFDYCGFLVSFQIRGYEYSTTFFFYSIEKHYWDPFISIWNFAQLINLAGKKATGISTDVAFKL